MIRTKRKRRGRSTHAGVIRRFPAGGLFALVLALCLSACGGSASTGPDGKRPESTEVLVFAAASLRDVIDDVARSFEEEFAEEGYTVVANYAGSNALAQQIRATARADVFISANEAWMDDVEAADRIVPDSRRTLFYNRLVVVVATDSDLEIDEPTDLATAPVRHLSIGDPNAVPAGIYAREWLASIPYANGTLWDAVEENVVPGANVRAALGLVEADTRIAGIVYATDAAASNRVRVVCDVPRKEGPDIQYVGALVRGGRAPTAAREFLNVFGFHAGSPDVDRIVRDHGFGPPRRLAAGTQLYVDPSADDDE